MTKKLLKFHIILDRDSLLYLPGQVLAGRVLLETQENTAVLGLYFHVLGECTVHVAKGTRRQDKSYDKENYIDFRMKLLDDFDNKPILLSPGVHCFPFKLGLPVSLPSTFIGQHGWIQYYCKSSLQETSGITHRNQQVFIVLNPIDLNLEDPLMGDPLEASVNHRVGVGYLGGTIRCNVGLDKRAYVPGENILLTGEIHNQSNVTIKTMKYALIEILIEPNLMERQMVLKVPITLGTYPFRRDDQDLQEWVENYVRYPATLPVTRASAAAATGC
ncbi:arrestin domain-containing protein 17-like isoform X2 [Topomyia yanbarensis]|uniref:arrestin domain-containing protein 17-like isoform X2 n=1 Tax=Topomyia yanbarensis TaxID=2498891 RepID=UPI00273B2F02|nr:arrestin domain-containing protein 17-like isoform X2 [Topomyia yanbarensis]